MAAQNIEEKNLKGSIFSIDVSKGPRLLSMRTGTACAVKREGSTRILLVTSSKVVQHLGDSSTQGNLSCKPFCPGFPVHEDKYIIKETIPPGNTEQFCYIPLQTAPKHCLELVSADKLREAGERLIQSSCLSYTFFGNCFKTMTWEFNEERQIHELTAVDPEGELVSSACRGSPVVSTEDEDRSVIGVVDCTSEGDLCLNFFKESSLDIGRSLDIKGGRPYVEILEQPKQRGLRFRYPCEGPSPGGLSGQYSEKGKKSHPSVQLCNYQGPARIVVSLVTVDEPPMPHAHSLIGKNSNNGVVTVQTGPELAMRACFPNLGIQHATRKIAGKVLMERYIKMHSLHTATLNAPTADDKAIDVAVRGDQALADGERATFDNNVAEAVTEGELQLVRQMVEEQMQNINLNAVRLCFQAYLPDDSGCFTKALRPCISNPVYNSSASERNDLYLMSRTSL